MIRRVVGRLIVANFDPTTQPAEEIGRLNEEAEAVPANEILVEIRPNHPRGQFPIRDP